MDYGVFAKSWAGILLLAALSAPLACSSAAEVDVAGGTTSGGACATQATPPAIAWTKQAAMGDTPAIALDAAGNVVVAGQIDGSIDFGLGPLVTSGPEDADGFVVKLDPNGAPIWNVASSGMDNGPVGIAVDNLGNVALVGDVTGPGELGGVSITGILDGDMFIAKLDADGNPLWATSVGVTGLVQAAGVAADGEGNVVAVGTFEDTVHIGSTELHPGGTFVAKLDADGNPLWVTRAPDDASGVALDGDGNIVVVGLSLGSVDCGTMTGSGPGNTTVFVEKLDPAGACQWAEAFEADWGGTAATLSVATDSAGNIAMAGGSTGPVRFGDAPLAPAPGDADTFVVKLSPEGAPQWARLFEGHPQSGANGVAVDGAGDVLVTGYYDTSVDFACGSVGGGGPDASGAYVAALSPDGVTLWARTFRDEDPENGDEIDGSGVVADAAGNVYVTGYFDGSIDYGNGPILSSMFSVFLVKLNP